MEKIINNEKEIWKAHPEYAGIEVSTLGRVRTLDKMVWNGRGTYLLKGRVLKQRDNGNGYLRVNIKVDGKFIAKYIHRLVAQTFITNPDNLPEVNHKDCNPQNNNVENLEFCTRLYNNQYKEKFGISTTESQGNPLFAINLATMEVSHFRSQREASRELGADSGSINNVIKGKYKYTRGYWFVNDDKNADDAISRKLQEIKKTKLALYR